MQANGGGLFNNDFATDPRFLIGMGLLAGNQRSLTPTNPMQSVMQNLMMGQQLKRQSKKDERDQQMYDLQKEELAYKRKAAEAKANMPIEISAGATLLDPNTNQPVYTAPNKPESLPAAIKEYQFAVKQGFKGSFSDWEVKMANAKASNTTINLPPDMPYELEKGFMLKDPNDPSKGVTPIPGGGKDQSTPEQAAKIQMLKTAQDAYTEVKDLIYDENGDIDRENLFNAIVGMPFSEGRDLGIRMETGIQAITRAETGAAMPDTEVENTKKRFMPSPLDSEKTIKLKLQLYEDFISGSLKLIDPSGRFDNERFETELKARKKQSPVPDSLIDSLINKYAN